MIHKLITGVPPVCDFGEASEPGDGDGQGYGLFFGEGFGDGYYSYPIDGVTISCDTPVALIPEE